MTRKYLESVCKDPDNVSKPMLILLTIEEWLAKNQINMIIATVMVLVAFAYGIYIGNQMGKAHAQIEIADLVERKVRDIEYQQILEKEKRLYTVNLTFLAEALDDAIDRAAEINSEEELNTYISTLVK